MISNERPSPFGHQPYHQPYAPQAPRPFVQEDTLKSGEIQIERKIFHLTLKENPRGRFLRISEENNAKRNSIIIPAPGLKDFQKLINEMVKASDEIPAKSAPAGLRRFDSSCRLVKKLGWRAGGRDNYGNRWRILLPNIIQLLYVDFQRPAAIAAISIRPMMLRHFSLPS